MEIKEILDYDINAKEADILISDGQNEILCYAYPFENKNHNNFMLETFMAKDVMRIEEKRSSIIKSSSEYYAYKLCGKVIDLEKRLISIGEIVIQLEDIIPKDIIKNDFIEFSVMRIDYIEL